MGFVHARRALHGRFDLVQAYSIGQAVTLLQEGGIDAILCSIHFDESRMFDFLRAARSIGPDTPFICCRMLYSPLTRNLLDGLLTSARFLGAVGFVDYNDLQRSLGFDEADRQFGQAIDQLLDPGPSLQRSTGS